MTYKFLIIIPKISDKFYNPKNNLKKTFYFEKKRLSVENSNEWYYPLTWCKRIICVSVFKGTTWCTECNSLRRTGKSYQCDEPQIIAKAVFETDWNFVKLACELNRLIAILSTIFIIVAPWDMGPGSKLDTISLS